MINSYTEDQLVEQPAIGLFAELAWQTVSASEETFGASGTLLRETKGEVVLLSRLRMALERHASGVTFKEGSHSDSRTIEFLELNPGRVRRFEFPAGPMAKQLLSLQRRIQNLRRTRDLLLPRLLSGQVAFNGKET